MHTYKIIPPAISSGTEYTFTTDSGIEYEVRFGRKQDNILHASIIFGVLNDEFDGDEYALTNKGEVFKVMSTIVAILKLFMNNHPSMFVYEFTGVYKKDEEQNRISARVKLYKRYLPAIFDHNWVVDYSGGNTIVANRKH